MALGYLAGGLWLIQQGVISWRVPTAFLATLGLISGAFALVDATQYAGPTFHLFTGGAMLGAFFIATDPVTAASTPLGKLIYAGLAGFLTAIIRGFGGYPDGVAFAVQIANVCVPFIDAYTQPRVFGHRKAGK